MSNVSTLLCPCCDKAIESSTKVCPQCSQPIAVSAASLSTMEMPLVNKYLKGYNKILATDPDNQEFIAYAAMCFLRLKLYDKALPMFEKSIDGNYDSSEPYFMAAICQLRGKKPFLTQRADIDKSIKYLNAANMLEPKAIHYEFLSYIKQDYFERKYLNIHPSAQDEHRTALQYGLDEKTMETLTFLLGG